jgi:hypothetical protein
LVRDFVCGRREGMYRWFVSEFDGEEKKLGKKREIDLRRVGKQAATTEQLHSSEDQ